MGIASTVDGCAAVVLDSSNGAVVRSGAWAHPPGALSSPEVRWRAVLGAVEDAGGLTGIHAWSIAADPHVMVALDAQGRVVPSAPDGVGLPLAVHAAELVLGIGAGTLLCETGMLPGPETTLAQVRRLRVDTPAAGERVEVIALLHDWLTWRLRGFGRGVESCRGPVLDQLVTDRSDAAGTGYFDAVSNRYLPELLEAVLGRAVRVPPVLGHREGRFDHEGRIAGAGASADAAIAVAVDAGPGDVVVVFGPAGAVFAVGERRLRETNGAIGRLADARGGYLFRVRGFRDAAEDRRSLDRSAAAVHVLARAGVPVRRILLVTDDPVPTTAAQRAFGAPVQVVPLADAAARGMAMLAADLRTCWPVLPARATARARR